MEKKLAYSYSTVIHFECSEHFFWYDFAYIMKFCPNHDGMEAFSGIKIDAEVVDIMRYKANTHDGCTTVFGQEICSETEEYYNTEDRTPKCGLGRREAESNRGYKDATKRKENVSKVKFFNFSMMKLI